MTRLAGEMMVCILFVTETGFLNCGKEYGGQDSGTTVIWLSTLLLLTINFVRHEKGIS